MIVSRSEGPTVSKNKKRRRSLAKATRSLGKRPQLWQVARALKRVSAEVVADLADDRNKAVWKEIVALNGLDGSRAFEALVDVSMDGYLPCWRWVLPTKGSLWLSTGTVNLVRAGQRPRSSSKTLVSGAGKLLFDPVVVITSPEAERLHVGPNQVLGGKSPPKATVKVYVEPFPGGPEWVVLERRFVKGVCQVVKDEAGSLRKEEAELHAKIAGDEVEFELPVSHVGGERYELRAVRAKRERPTGQEFTNIPSGPSDRKPVDVWRRLRLKWLRPKDLATQLDLGKLRAEMARARIELQTEEFDLEPKSSSHFRADNWLKMPWLSKREVLNLTAGDLNSLGGTPLLERLTKLGPAADVSIVSAHFFSSEKVGFGIVASSTRVQVPPSAAKTKRFLVELDKKGVNAVPVPEGLGGGPAFSDGSWGEVGSAKRTDLPVKHLSVVSVPHKEVEPQSSYGEVKAGVIAIDVAPFAASLAQGKTVEVRFSVAYLEARGAGTITGKPYLLLSHYGWNLDEADSPADNLSSALHELGHILGMVPRKADAFPFMARMHGYFYLKGGHQGPHCDHGVDAATRAKKQANGTYRNIDLDSLPGAKGRDCAMYGSSTAGKSKAGFCKECQQFLLLAPLEV